MPSFFLHLGNHTFDVDLFIAPSKEKITVLKTYNTEHKRENSKHAVFIACDFCVLTFEFYVVSFPFYVMCFWDSEIPLRRLDKKIYSEIADSRKEKKVCREIKTGMRIILYFMQF